MEDGNITVSMTGDGVQLGRNNFTINKGNAWIGNWPVQTICTREGPVSIKFNVHGSTINNQEQVYNGISKIETFKSCGLSKWGMSGFTDFNGQTVSYSSHSGCLGFYDRPNITIQVMMGDCGTQK